MSASWHLAQINVATALYPLEDPRMGGFVGRLDEINRLADRAAGFVWRLQSGSGNATDIQVTGDPKLIINMSVWESVEALHAFAYKTRHAEVFAARKKWFEPAVAAHQALWWHPAGARLPTAEEGMRRLGLMRDRGPTLDAFTFKHRFPPPEAEAA